MGHINYIVYAIENIDYNTVASGAGDSTIKIWRISTGATISSITTSSPIYNLILLSNGYLACGLTSSNNNLLLWNYTNGILENSLNGHTSSVNYLEILSDQYLASASSDTRVIIWNLTETRSIGYTLISHTGPVWIVKRLSDKLLASGGAGDFSLRIWNWNSGQLIRILAGHTSTIYWSMELFDDYTLISGSMDTTIKFWNISTGNLIRNINTNMAIDSMSMIKTCNIFFYNFKLAKEALYPLKQIS